MPDRMGLVALRLTNGAGIKGAIRILAGNCFRSFFAHFFTFLAIVGSFFDLFGYCWIIFQLVWLLLGHVLTFWGYVSFIFC